MPRKIDLTLLQPMLDSGKDFELSPAEYERIIGRALPKTDDYLKYKSPVAKEAKEKGYRIHLVERVVMQRIVVFEKKKESR